jgi:hypothetical protein
MARILIRDCRVWDGSGAAAYPADVLVEGERIRAVATQRGQIEAAGAEIVEARGMTLMPGLVEGHAHITFINGARPTDLGDTPPEEHTLIAARNARLLLDHGFTGAYSAASAKLRIDVVIRNAIEAGELPGPRLRACGPEITVTGGLGDERRAHQFRDSFAMFADGPVEVTKLARMCVREGVDSIKLNISGDDHTRAGALPRTVMSEEEILAGVAVARDFHRMVNAHCRAAESVKRAVRCGVDVTARLCEEHNLTYPDIDRIEAVVNWLETEYPSPAFPTPGSDGKPRVGSTQYFSAYGAVTRGYPLLRGGQPAPGETDPPEVLDLMHRVTLIPTVRRTLFGPRITVFTKDGRRFTKEGTGREFIWDFEEQARRIGPIASGIAISATQYAELVDACRHLDRIGGAGRRLVELTIAG